jgi:hypothetical protein
VVCYFEGVVYSRIILISNRCLQNLFAIFQSQFNREPLASAGQNRLQITAALAQV